MTRQERARTGLQVVSAVGRVAVAVAALVRLLRTLGVR